MNEHIRIAVSDIAPDLWWSCQWAVTVRDGQRILDVIDCRSKSEAEAMAGSLRRDYGMQD